MIVKRILKKVFNVNIFRELPPGVDVFNDILKYFPNIRFQYIFDVGAHKGGFTSYGQQWFPQARFFLFEPVPENYRQLKQKFQHKPGITLEQLAVSETSETGRNFQTAASYAGKLSENATMRVLKLM